MTAISLNRDTLIKTKIWWTTLSNLKEWMTHRRSIGLGHPIVYRLRGHLVLSPFTEGIGEIPCINGRDTLYRLGVDLLSWLEGTLYFHYGVRFMLTKDHHVLITYPGETWMTGLRVGLVLESRDKIKRPIFIFLDAGIFDAFLTMLIIFIEFIIKNWSKMAFFSSNFDKYWSFSDI